MIEKAKPPELPFIGTKRIEIDNIEKIINYIDKNSLYRFHWRVEEKTGEELFKEYIPKVLNKIEPISIVGYFYGEKKGDSIIVKDIELCFERDIRSGISILDFFSTDKDGKTPIIIFSVSLGENAMKEVDNAYKDERYFDYLILHGLYSEIVEGIADYLHERVLKELNIKTKYRVRYSPGYPPAWKDIKENQKLIRLLKAEKFGITFKENSLYPRYTILALINWHPEGFYF